MLKDYPNYDIDELGNVMNLSTGKILKQNLDSNGYFTISLCKDGIPKTHLIHRLLTEKFLKDFSTTTIVDHIDGNKTNNNLNNLRMVDATLNARNSKAKGYSWNAKREKYEVQIMVNYKKKHIGYYDLEDDAITAAALAKIKYHGLERRAK